jgi:hypothetical protein
LVTTVVDQDIQIQVAKAPEQLTQVVQVVEPDQEVLVDIQTGLKLMAAKVLLMQLAAPV